MAMAVRDSSEAEVFCMAEQRKLGSRSTYLPTFSVPSAMKNTSASPDSLTAMAIVDDNALSECPTQEATLTPAVATIQADVGSWIGSSLWASQSTMAMAVRDSSEAEVFCMAEQRKLGSR
ncbi:hypothetical protein SESBI_26986 [Sesbania bispinosa]|nr:hypothetical protein SESBI_26986 [Sesbania bispinosa]